MASGNLWKNKRIADNPEVVATTSYQYERDGSKLKIKIDTENHCTSSGAYWDWRWAFNVTVNGQEIAHNVEIKPRTYLNTIGTTVYDASTGWAILDIGSSDIKVAVSFYDTQAGNDSKVRKVMYTGQVTIGDEEPEDAAVEIDCEDEYPYKTDSSIKIWAEVDADDWDFLRVYCNGHKWDDYESRHHNFSFIVDDLKPDKEYRITAKVYYDDGKKKSDESNALNIKTFKKYSTVSSATVGNIEPFTCTAYATSSNTSNTSTYEYTLCNSNRQPIGGAIRTNFTYCNITGMNEETSYCIRCRVQSKDSGAWSDYVYSSVFKTPADQVRAWTKINGNWNKGKMYLKKNGQWVKAKKAYIKINGQWVLSKNKYD